MSTELAQALYDAIPKITHLRTFLYMRAIEENRDPDGYSRITYAKWRDTYGLHAFILNECTAEAQRLGFIEIARETKNGIIGADEGGKGSKRLYKLTLENIGKVSPNVEPKQEIIEPENKPEPIVVPEKVESKRSAPLPATKFNKGKKVDSEKPKQDKKTPAKKAVSKPVKKSEKIKSEKKVPPKSKAPIKKGSKKK